MKFILFVIISIFIASETTKADGINLLLPDSIPTVEGEFMDNKTSTAYEFNGEEPYVLGDTTYVAGEELSTPFIVTATFKSYTGTSSCLFSIERKKDIILKLCVSPVARDVTRITLQTNLFTKSDAIMFVYSDNFKQKWLKITIHVKDDSAVLYVNCTKQPKEVSSLEKISDVHFPDDIELRLAFSQLSKYRFKGAIQEIRLYNKATDFTRESICDEWLRARKRLMDDYEDFSSTETKISDPVAPVPMITEKGEKGMKGEKGDVGATGLKGEKGDRGDMGPKGDVGPIGPTGPTGPSGLKGDEGECSCSEDVVSSLLKSMPEMRGPAGEKGERGEKGETGERGDDGTPGREGDRGQKGEPGHDGTPGTPGERGPEGPRGPPGPIYVETEEERRARIVKIPGEVGPPGPVGPPGMPGLKGEKGDVGPPGKPGPQGEKGNEGHKGHQGEKGEKGERGEAGKHGVPGIHGHDGKPGETGEKGERGDKGAPGLAGLPAKLSSLLDPLMDPDENAAIVKKLRGHKGETGDKGAKGDEGPMGLQGPSGEDGKDGLPGKDGVDGEKGDRGFKGDQGDPGPPGEVPASRIALMKGPKGDIGQPGPQGKPGPKGEPGEAGETGSDGPKGDKGDMGDKGLPGSPGVNGTTGEKGEKGETPKINYTKLKGDKGDRGIPGYPGMSGDAGPIGPIGPPGTCTEECPRTPAVGVPGRPGPRGPPGPPGPPGLSIVGPKGEPGQTHIQRESFDTSYPPRRKNPHDEDGCYSTNTLVYQSRTSLLKKTEETDVGTLAYVLEEKILLLRVENGWQNVVMGSLIDQRPISTTTTTTLKPIHLPERVPSTTVRPSTHKPRVGVIRLVALNEPHPGILLYHKNNIRTGREGADLLCHEQSMTYRLGATFKPFLATEDQDLLSLIQREDRHLPVVNLNGSILFHSWQSIFDGSGAEFISKLAAIYSFNGKSVLIDPTWPNKIIWHGSVLDRRGTANKAKNCNNWRSGSRYYKGIGSSLENNLLLNQEMFSCDNKFIVLCVEVDPLRSRKRKAASERRKRHHRRRDYLLN